MRAVLDLPLLVRRRLADPGGAIPCGSPLATDAGKEVVYQDVSQFDGVLYVGYLAFGLGLGGLSPATFTKTPTGYSFSGMVALCNQTWLCANGQPQSYHVSLSGEVKTGPEPDVLSYEYAIDVFCGGVFTCRESGSFSGTRRDYSATRKGGAPGSPTGIFYGTQTWTLACCAARYAP